MTKEMFKVKGVPRLITYEELMKMRSMMKITNVRVIDLKTQKNWNTNMKTVIDKFR